MKQFIAIILVCFLANNLHATTITNFTEVYDTVTNRVQYTFDLTPTSDIISLYLDYDSDPQGSTPPNPFIAGTTLLDSTVNGAVINTILDLDEIVFSFTAINTATSVGFILGGIDASLITGDYNINLRTNHFGPGLINFLKISRDSSSGSVPTSFSVPEPSSLLLLGFGIIGLGFSRRKIL